jgi:hypothetical protein
MRSSYVQKIFSAVSSAFAPWVNLGKDMLSARVSPWVDAGKDKLTIAMTVPSVK